MDGNDRLEVMVVGDIRNGGDGQKATEIIDEFKDMEDLLISLRRGLHSLQRATYLFQFFHSLQSIVHLECPEMLCCSFG